MSDVEILSDSHSMPLNGEQILAQIRANEVSDLVESIEVLQTIDSTNSYLLSKSTVVGKARVCIAEAQQSGRGRRGNDWLSAPYKNIMLSLSWGFAGWPITVTGLGLVVSLVVAERLNADYRLGVEIKWPNDLLINGDKLAGILVEAAGDVSGACNVVIGIGLNVHQPDWSKNSADYAWTDLHSQAVEVNRNHFAGSIVSDLLNMLPQFAEHGFTPFVPRWNSLSSYTNKQVGLYRQGTQVLIGTMLGVNEMGALLIFDDEQEHQINDSSLSLRLLASR